MSSHMHSPIERGGRVVCRGCGQTLAIVQPQSTRYPAPPITTVPKATR